MLQFFYCDSVIASILNSISIKNNANQSIVTICCNIIPSYTIFSLQKPERIVIDLFNISKIQKHIFPIKFDNCNLIQRIRIGTSVHIKSIRIVCDLHYVSNIQTITQKKIGKNYCIILFVAKSMISISDYNNQNLSSITVENQKKCIVLNKKDKYFLNQIKTRNINTKQRNYDHIKIKCPIIVAIDAGHGGHDPGATGCHGIYEKNITFEIASRLKKLLDIDPIFKAVMIRNGDYFLSVMERSDLARKNKANILVSIHADSALNPKVKGASVWILSNTRAKVEMMYWLQCREKYAELLGGLGDILTNYKIDPYFNHLVLDLQFGYAQRESYNIATHMLNQLKNVSSLHKNAPEYSNFGVLRSPDIASVLVETGFISNIQEENLLITHRYQEKIAQALYKGLRSYLLIHNKKYL